MQPPDTLAGRTVLLVEDDYFVARDLEDELRAQGIQIVGPASDVKSALHAIAAADTIDAAVLDINLHGDVAYPIALALEQRGIPFIFATGYGARTIPSRFSEVTHVEKPFSAAEITAALRQRMHQTEGAAPRAPGGAATAEVPHPLLRRLSHAVELSDEDRRLIEAATARTRLVKAQRTIVEEGERNRFVRLVMDGFACRYKVLESGLRHITGFLMPGDLCDFHVTVLGEMDHSVAALSDCVIVDLAPDTVAQLNARPQIQRAFWWTTFVNEAVLRAWLVNIGSKPASQRMAHLLCEWFTRLDAVALAGNGSCPFPLTQEDLGHTLGLSGVHANRTLQQLRRMGLVTVRGKTLTILDLPRLAAFAEFDPSYLRLGMRAQS